MRYTMQIDSPIGPLLLTADEEAILLVERKTAAGQTHPSPLLEKACAALQRYFAGEREDFDLPLAPEGTPFQQEVWRILRQTPYGQTTTYGEIARIIAAERDGRMSAQAVGGAVGKNPILIMIPCHRVLGSTGALTGFREGLENKEILLRREGILP